MNIFGFHICMDEIGMVLPFVPVLVLVARSAWSRAGAGVRALARRR